MTASASSASSSSSSSSFLHRRLLVLLLVLLVAPLFWLVEAQLAPPAQTGGARPPEDFGQASLPFAEEVLPACEGRPGPPAPALISSAEDAQALADMVRCTGGDFEVEWAAGEELILPTTVMIGRGTKLSVDGRAPSGVPQLQGVVNGGGGQRLFLLLAGAELHLKNVRLQGGFAEVLPADAASIHTKLGGGAVLSLGGTVICDSCIISRSGTDWGDGGGVMVRDGGGLLLRGESSLQDNVATRGRGGGAVAVNGSSLTLLGESSVHRNQAGIGGGGLCARYNGSRLLLGENATVSSNTSREVGGGIFVAYEAVGRLQNSSRVHDNNVGELADTPFMTIPSPEILNIPDREAVQSARGAGVAVAIGSSLFMSDDSSVDHNGLQIPPAVGGGLLTVAGSQVVLSGRSRVSHNVAVAGGGISLMGQCRCTISDASSIYGNEAVASGGGGLDLREQSELSLSGTASVFNNTGREGGGLAMLDSKMDAIGRVRIEMNSARGGGGGAIRSSGSSVLIGGAVRISGNTAGDRGGGAIYASESSVVLLSGSCLIEQNAALGGGGGGIFLSHGQMNISQRASVDGNEALVGGGIYAKDMDALPITKILIEGSSSLSGNYAGTGGGIHMGMGAALLVEGDNVTFKDNSAVREDGGGLFLASGSTATLRGGNFVSNSAARAGAAIAMEDVSAAVAVSGDASAPQFSSSRAACCTEVPEKEVLSVGSATCEDVSVVLPQLQIGSCCSRGEFLGEGNVCNLCALTTGVDCGDDLGLTLSNLPLLPGFWRTSMTSSTIRECPTSEACAGGHPATGEPDGYCAGGFEGPYCALCEEGRTRSAQGGCQECTSPALARQVLAAVAFIIFLVTLTALALRDTADEARQEQTDSSILEILGLAEAHEIFSTSASTVASFLQRVPWGKLRFPLITFQIITTYFHLTGINFPEIYVKFLNWISVLSLDIGWLLSLDCLGASLDFYDTLLAATLFPPAFLLMLGTLRLLLLLRRGQPIDWRRVVPVRTLLLLLFILYSSISSVVFQTLSCEHMEETGESFLRADYSISCDTDEYRAYRVYAFAMIAVYPIGIIVVLCWYLWQAWGYARAVKSVDGRLDIPILRDGSFLWKPYRSHCYFWEAVECVRRLMLTGLLVFIGPGTPVQSWTACILAFLGLLVFSVANPLPSKVDRHLYAMGCLVIFLNMSLALISSYSDITFVSAGGQEVLAKILIACNVLLVLVALISMGMVACQVGELLPVDVVLARCSSTDQTDETVDLDAPYMTTGTQKLDPDSSFEGSSLGSLGISPSGASPPPCS